MHNRADTRMLTLHELNVSAVFAFIGRMKVGRNLKKDLTLELAAAAEMTAAEVDSIAALLFTWWRRDYEQQGTPPSNKGLNPPPPHLTPSKKE